MPVQPPSAPEALKEQTLTQLIEIRETLLSQDWQEKIDKMPPDKRHEVILLVSQSQINYLKLQRTELETITKGLAQQEKELIKAMKQLQDSMDNVSKLDAFVNGATGFIKLVQNILKALSPLI